MLIDFEKRVSCDTSEAVTTGSHQLVAASLLWGDPSGCSFLQLFKKIVPAIAILHLRTDTTRNARVIIFRMHWSGDEHRT